MMRGILLFFTSYFATTIGENVNIPLGKNVSASSHLPESPPEKAVDGKRNAIHGPEVFHTPYVPGVNVHVAWWSVDLGLEVISPQVVIYFRTYYASRRNGVRISLSPVDASRRNGVRISLSPVEGNTTDFCEVVTGAADGSDISDIYNFTCDGKGRYQYISTVTGNDGDGVVLDFGEVEVYVDELNMPQCKVTVSFKFEAVDMALVEELEQIELYSRIECMLNCKGLDLCTSFEYQRPTCKFWKVGSSGRSGTSNTWKKH